MDDYVTAANPILPGVVITVPAEAMVHLRPSGWDETDPPAPEPTTDELDAALLAAAGYGPEPEPEPEPEPVDYTGWLKADLVAEAEARGLDTSGTKDDLIARLDGNDVTATEPDQPEEPSAEESAS
jgi:hypothetical protein